MHLNDCEVSTREVRGHRLVILFGPHKVSEAEGGALLSQYFATHIGPAPIFASPDGWQVLEPAPAAVPEVAPAVAAEPPTTRSARKNAT